MKRIKEIFEPNKITLAGKATIVDTDSGKYVIKEKEKDIPSLFKYLNNRAFTNYPKIIDTYDNNVVYEYLNSVDIPINQKANDMAVLLASLHYKTSYYTPVVKDDIKKVYEELNDNILYFENYYNRLFDNAFKEEYMRPSYYLLLRNQSKILALFKYLKDELEKWYNSVIDKDKTRLVYCHNNLSIDHFIPADKNYFISWDKYTVDSPVLDLLNVYQNDFNKYDYSTFLRTYFKNMEWLPEEKRLFFITISLPKIYYFTEDEMNNTIKVSKFIDYINNTEKLIRPYYPIEDVK